MAIRAEEISGIIAKQIEEYGRKVEVAEVGRILTVGDNIARIYGLENAQAGELLEFPNDVMGMALNLEEDNVGAVLFGEGVEIKEGMEVKRTGRIVSTPIGRQMMGRVVNGLGLPIDGKGDLDLSQSARVEVKAPGIVYRKSVHEPLQTGIKA
ncbi:F0F1 ATP synthase subunit alpha, partial [bacterium]|nr:F0F1 ATP synthase subunit alpha [bacterium]